MKVENCPSSKTFLLKIQVKPARVTHNKNSIRKAVAFIFGSFFLQEEIPQNNMVKNIGKKPPDRKMPLLEFVNTNKILKYKCFAIVEIHYVNPILYLSSYPLQQVPFLM